MTSKIRPISAASVWAALGAVLMLTFLLAWSAPAQATVIMHETYSDSFSEDFEECGMPRHLESVFSGRFHFRVGKHGDESAFFVHDRGRFTDTITNPANDRFFTVEGHLLFNEIKATRVVGNVFEFTAINAGAVLVRDDSGKVVLRDRGSIRNTILFDTLGDGVPGGVFVDDVSEVIHGPHPFFTLDDEEFCALTNELLGVTPG